MKYIVWRLIGFYGFVFLFGHILLYGNNRFAEKRYKKSKLKTIPTKHM